MSFRLVLSTQQGPGHRELCSETFSEQTKRHMMDGKIDTWMLKGEMNGWVGG